MMRSLVHPWIIAAVSYPTARNSRIRTPWCYGTLIYHLRRLIVLACILFAGSSCADHSDRTTASGPADRKNAPLPARSTVQSRESFITQFYSAHKKGDREAMNSLCRDNPSEAKWAMFQLGKLVAYFDDMNDHPALAGTEIGGEVVEPGALRAVVQDLETSIGPTAEGLRVEITEAYSSEAQTSKADVQPDSQEWDVYLKCFEKVDIAQYRSFLREFTMAYFKQDEAELHRLVTTRSGLIPPLLRDYYELLEAMAAHTNMESVSFEWSGGVSWNVPKLFDVIAALAYFQSQVSQDPSSMVEMSVSLEQVLSASRQAAERAEAADRDAVAIDKYQHIVALAENFKVPGMKPMAFKKLSTLYYENGNATKARQYAQKARGEAN